MTFRILLIIFSIVGISASFMPWLHYPQVDGIFYGYMADGAITGFVFMVILVLELIFIRKKTFPLIGSSIIAFLGLGMALIALSKIRAIRIEQLNFNVSDPRISRISAGFHEGIGIYVFGFAGLMIFLVLLTAIISTKYSANETNHKKGFAAYLSLKNLLIASFALFAIIISLTILTKEGSNGPSKEEIQTQLNIDVTAMGEALASQDYESFINYNHPLMVQSLGGHEKALQLIQAGTDEGRKQGILISRTKLQKVHDIKGIRNNLQATISQEVQIINKGTKQTESQKMLAVSEDGGVTWKYLNINGKSKEQIQAVFPKLNQNLDFDY